MAPRHKFVSLMPDMGGPTHIQPTHWNDAHVGPPAVVFRMVTRSLAASIGVPSTAGATGYETPDNTSFLRMRYDFAEVDTLYISAGVASTWALGSVALRLQYMASGFPGSWYSFDATGGSGPFVSIASGNNASVYLMGSNGPMVGPSVAVGAAAVALSQPLTIRLAAYGGNGSGIGIGNVDVFGL